MFMHTNLCHVHLPVLHVHTFFIPHTFTFTVWYCTLTCPKDSDLYRVISDLYHVQWPISCTLTFPCTVTCTMYTDLYHVHCLVSWTVTCIMYMDMFTKLYHVHWPVLCKFTCPMYSALKHVHWPVSCTLTCPIDSDLIMCTDLYHEHWRVSLH